MADNKAIIYEKAPEVDLKKFFGFLLRYKWFLIISTAGMVVILLLFFWITGAVKPADSILPDIYKPVSLLLFVDRSNSSLLSSLQSLSDISGGLGISTSGLLQSFNYGDLALQLIKSKTILDIIAAEFDIRTRYKIKNNHTGKSRRKIIDHLAVVYDEKTRLLSIGYNDYDPVFASRIVNRFVELLDQRFLKIGGNRSLEQIQLLENNLAEVNARVAVLEEEIKKFQTRYGTLDIQSLATEQVTMMARLRSQLILKEMEIKTYADFSTIEDPVLKRLKSEQQNLQNLIGEMESGYTEYNSILPNQQDLSDLALDFAHKQRDLSIQEKIYEILTHQYELLKLTIGNTEPVFQVIEMADIPDLKTSPQRGQLTVIFSIAALFLNTLAAFFYHITINKNPGTEKAGGEHA